VDGELQPLAWVDVYLDGRIARPSSCPAHAHRALPADREQTGEMFTEIQQEIRATLVDALVAERLGAEVGSRLQITRRYFSTGRRLVRSPSTCCRRIASSIRSPSGGLTASGKLQRSRLRRAQASGVMFVHMNDPTERWPSPCP